MKTVKVLAAIVIAIGFSSISYGQKAMEGSRISPMQVGSTTLSMGVGVGSQYKNGDYNNPFGTKVALEFGLWQAGPGVITLGPEAGGSFSNYYNDHKYRTIVIAARSAWHYGWNVPNLDTYAGLSAGIGFHHVDLKDGESYNETFGVFGAFIGASYFVTPSFGFNVEAGHDITNFQGGIVFKLN